MTDNEPLQRAMPCPYERLPASVRSAVNTGTKNGWICSTSFAIGPAPEAVQSVVFRARRAGVRLASRHEARQQDETFGFKVAFIQRRDDNHGWPKQVGWRELQALLRGED